MSTQIFKNMIPSEKIFHLLDLLCIKNYKYYLFDSISFKKGIFTEEINKFLASSITTEMEETSKPKGDIELSQTYFKSILNRMVKPFLF